VRLLTYTNLYPGADHPRHGIFVEERLRHLVASGDVTASVCALRPQNSANPFRFFGRSINLGTELRHGISVNYATVPSLPLITNWVDPLLWANATQDVVEKQIGEIGRGVVIDAHFLYPDGVAAVILGRRLGLPVVLSARGSDVNIKCENPIMRRWVRWAAIHCSALITVSQALANRLTGLGITAKTIVALPNGVDLNKFRWTPSKRCFPGIKAAKTILLSAGHLLEAKGHHIAIQALPDLPDTHLLIVGEGSYEQALRSQTVQLEVADRVHFLGYVPHTEMAEVFSKADFTILASENEGMPNVVLESLACGTRVIATNVGGVSEVLTEAVAGELMKSRDAAALRDSLTTLQASEHSRDATRLFATLNLDWSNTVERQQALYERIAYQ